MKEYRDPVVCRVASGDEKRRVDDGAGIGCRPVSCEEEADATAACCSKFPMSFREPALGVVRAVEGSSKTWDSKMLVRSLWNLVGVGLRRARLTDCPG